MAETKAPHDVTPEEVAAFYEETPCGNQFVELKDGDWKRFYLEYDAFRYRRGHLDVIPKIMDGLDLRGKEVLEIGTGQGSDAQLIIERGGVYTGVDITPESLKRLKRRFELFNLPYRALRLENAEELTLPDASFDIVYSNGVLLTSPRIEKIVHHVHRVLKPGGKAVVMLYHKDSINYHISIKVLRRLGIFLLFVPGMGRIVAKLTNEPLERLDKHRISLQRDGLAYLKMENFIHKSTDGPDNPYTSVWNRESCERLFHMFSRREYDAAFINERHFPVVRHLVPRRAKEWMEHRWGWNLYITLTK